MIIEDLTKRYGKRRGVTNVNLEVSSGQVFGFIGPNGSGKTTTIRLLMNFIQPTSGHAVVLGRDSPAAGPGDSIARRLPAPAISPCTRTCPAGSSSPISPT